MVAGTASNAERGVAGCGPLAAAHSLRRCPAGWLRLLAAVQRLRLVPALVLARGAEPPGAPAIGGCGRVRGLARAAGWRCWLAVLAGRVAEAARGWLRLRAGFLAAGPEARH